jgi:hypothetical protein
MDLKFGTRNVRTLYRAGSLITVAKEISKCILDLVGVQEVRWDRDGTEPAGKYTFLYGKGNENHELGTGFFFLHKIILGGRWCYVTVPNVHAPTEHKIYDMKDSFYEKLERVFDNFPKIPHAFF